MRPRRALLVTSNFPRWDGDSTTPFISRLAEDLQNEGWEIDVLAPHALGAARLETIAGVTVRRFRYILPESQQTVCYEGGALINLRKTKTNWIKLPLLALSELLVTLRLLATRRYAVVNAHWLLPQGFVAAIAGKLTRTPLATTIHGGDVFDLQGRVLGIFKRWALHHSAAVTVNSSATKKAIAAISPNTDTVTIPMGVDLPDAPDEKRVQGIRHDHGSANGPLLLFVGRLVFEKGLDDLFRAVALLSEDGINANLIVAGTGQDQEALQTLAHSLGLDKNVSFLGWIAPDQVHSYMAAADIFVGPSKQSESGWREGLGLVFLESMAAGTPVVATASGGIPDIVQHGRTGLLVAEEAPGAIAAAITQLLSDPSLASQMVANGRSLVQNSYTRTASAAAFAKLFGAISKT